MLRVLHFLGLAQGNDVPGHEFNGSFTSDRLKAIEDMAMPPAQPGPEDVRWYAVDFPVDCIDRRKIHCPETGG